MIQRLKLFFLVCAIGGTTASADALTVFAAASTKTALDEIAHSWKETSGSDIRLSYGGSSALARQIQQGAPADIYVSAHIAWMNVLDRDGLLIEGTQRNLLSNRLVVIAPDGSNPIDLADLPTALRDERLALGTVTAVPAGIYAKSALETLGLWQSLKGKTAQTENVRAALALVATGEAPYGIVYATDALAEPKVTVVATIEPQAHGPILYPVAAIQGGDTAKARAFIDFLFSTDAAHIFRQNGFQSPEAP